MKLSCKCCNKKYFILIIIIFLSGCATRSFGPGSAPLPYFSEDQIGNPTILDGLWQMQSSTTFSPTVRIKGGVMYSITAAPKSRVVPGMIIAKDIKLVNFPKFSGQTYILSAKNEAGLGETEIEVLNKEITTVRNNP